MEEENRKEHYTLNKIDLENRKKYFVVGCDTLRGGFANNVWMNECSGFISESDC